MIKQALIRADGDEIIGIGHVMRCLVLAKELNKRGFEVVWATTTKNKYLLSKIKQVSSRLYAIKQHTDLSETLNIISYSKPFFIILDGYHFDSKYQDTIFKTGVKIILIDDYCHLDKYYGHIIINQNYSAKEYKYNATNQTKYLLGTDYVLLREDFLSYKGIKKEIRDIAQNVLVTMGGGDSQDNAIKILKTLTKIEIPLKIKVILGVCNKSSLIDIGDFKRSHHKIETIHKAENMPELMLWADIAISAGGTTTWELLFMGVPAFLCITTTNQEAIVQSLSRDGFVISLGWLTDKNLRLFITNFTDLITDSNLRKQMSVKSQTLVDGEGISRILLEINNLYLENCKGYF